MDIRADIAVNDVMFILINQRHQPVVFNRFFHKQKVFSLRWFGCFNQFNTVGLDSCFLFTQICYLQYTKIDAVSHDLPLLTLPVAARLLSRSSIRDNPENTQEPGDNQIFTFKLVAIETEFCFAALEVKKLSFLA